MARKLIVMFMTAVLITGTAAGYGQVIHAQEADANNAEESAEAEEIMALTADTSDDVNEETEELNHSLLAVEVTKSDGSTFAETDKLEFRYMTDEETEKANAMLEKAVIAVDTKKAGPYLYISVTNGEKEEDPNEQEEVETTYCVSITGEDLSEVGSMILMQGAELEGEAPWGAVGFSLGKADALDSSEEPSEPEKDLEQIALEVRAGSWGIGEERVRRLTEAGYNAEAVQQKVNELYNTGSAAATAELTDTNENSNDESQPDSVTFETTSLGWFAFAAPIAADTSTDDAKQTEASTETPKKNPSQNTSASAQQTQPAQPAKQQSAAPASQPASTTPANNAPANTPQQSSTPTTAQDQAAPAHEHTWVHHDAVYNTVHHDAVYNTVHHDAVYETVHYDEQGYSANICNGCGMQNPDAVHLDETGHGSYHSEWIVTSPAHDEQVCIQEAYDEQVLVSEAYDEQVLVSPAYDQCSGCGATR